MWIVQKVSNQDERNTLMWFGPIKRMNEDQIANKVMKEERMGLKKGEEQESHGWIELMIPSKRER